MKTESLENRRKPRCFVREEVSKINPPLPGVGGWGEVKGFRCAHAEARSGVAAFRMVCSLFRADATEVGKKDGTFVS